MNMSAASPLNVGHIVDQAQWSPFQKMIVALAALAFAVDGLANQVLGLAIPSLVREWAQPRSAFAPVAALGLIGVAIGATLGGMLGDRKGRRFGLIGSTLAFGAATAASAFVQDIPQLLVLRLIAGLGIGGAIPNCAAMVSEFTAKRNTSVALAIAMAFIPVGGLLSGMISSYLLPLVGWRGLFLSIGVLPLIVSVAFMFILPESPRFLSRLPARRQELIRLLNRCRCGIHPDSQFAEEQASHQRSHLAQLFGDDVRHDTLSLWVGFFFCLLASYTMFSWIPSMLSSQGFDLSTTSMGLTYFNFGGIAGGLIGGWAIGRLGSRVSVLVLAGGSALGAIVLGVLPVNPENGFVLVACALITEGFFISGLHNGLYTLAAHIYPPYIRGTGVGAAAGIGRIGAVLSSYTGVLTLELGGSRAYFVVIAAAAGLSFLAIAMIRQHIPLRTR